MKLLSDPIKEWYINLINPAVEFFIKLEIHPNHFTTLGFLIQIVATYFIATEHFITGGFLVLASGTCDIIDGKVARARGIGTKFGALYDSTLDRYAEFVMFFGLGYYFIKNGWYLSSIIAFVALGGSLMTSYIRARSEALGLHAKVGSMQRPERVVYLGFASIFSGIPFLSPYPLILLLWMIAILSNITAFQRLVHVYKQTNDGKDLMGE